MHRLDDDRPEAILAHDRQVLPFGYAIRRTQILLQTAGAPIADDIRLLASDGRFVPEPALPIPAPDLHELITTRGSHDENSVRHEVRVDSPAAPPQRLVAREWICAASTASAGAP